MSLPLQGGPDPDPDRQVKFDQLSKAMPGFGGKSVEIRFGGATLTWSAAALSVVASVPHGLGRAPVSVQLTPDATFGASWHPVVNGYDASNLSVRGWSAAGVQTGSAVVYWIAIG